MHTNSAHGAYIGFLALEYTQNNSIMHVFCKLLFDKQFPSRTKIPKSTGTVSFSKENVSFEGKEELKMYLQCKTNKGLLKNAFFFCCISLSTETSVIENANVTEEAHEDQTGELL